ncbi:protein of unknown function DUF29 [Rippkaea orientalis PCC 8801]|uniref:DUF29 domain-containing protein n=1 Tax=Rippkaea orientalis (strain PCC 8801 / RF-1) TaxID=41431 RepID=B7JV94_RIPO1|nr:DUF29 domain-containing protein [Rippkaea orientalis]ACK68227.1 protein of unknown function DUF29 [Rippkaea orientalis PCC 8801]
MSSTLYDKDYHLWLQETVQLLQDGQLQELDIPDLIEEIQDMGKSQRKAVKSNLKVILWHLLKYKYQPEKRSNSWKSSIIKHRKRIRDAFEDSPSLKRYFNKIFDQSYQDSRELALAETGLSIETFPLEYSFTIAEILENKSL